MRRARLVLILIATAAAVWSVTANAGFGRSYATFSDSATGSAQVSASANFVPAQCQTIGATLSSWNVINGTAGNDTLVGTNGNDLIFGLAGNDSISGGNGTDCLVGGDDSDTILGNNAGDVLLGGNGNDGLNGGNGVDTCDGGDDTDTAINCETILNVP